MLKPFSYIILILFTTAINSNCHAQYNEEVYDFVPGEKVIFEDDFSKDTIDKFPSKWKKWVDDPSAATMEICTIEHDDDGNYVKINDEAEITLQARISKDLLGDTYTIEYDFMPMSNNSSAQIEIMSLNYKPKDTKDFYMTFSTGIYINGNGESNLWSPCWKKRKPKMQYPGTFVLGTWHHFAVAYKNKSIKFYVDHYHLFTMNSCDQSHSDLLLTPK